MLLSVGFPIMVWVSKFLWESYNPENTINGATEEGELGETMPLLLVFPLFFFLLLPLLKRI